MAGALTALGSGLLYRSDGSLTNWQGSAAWTSETLPACAAFDPSPYVAAAPTPGGLDAGGCRESWPFVDTDGTWYMFYGAGDGSTVAAGSGNANLGPWRPQMASSTNRGKTWTKLGPVPGILLNSGSGTFNFANDCLFIDLRAGVYYFHVLTSGSVTSNQIPNFGYSAAVWQLSGYASLAAAIAASAVFTYVRATVGTQAGTTYEVNGAYSGCIVLDSAGAYGAAGTYYLFYSQSYGAAYGVGLATATSPSGPFTKVAAASLNNTLLPTAIQGYPENPEVFFHSGLGLWVMLTNQVAYAAGTTCSSRAFFSTSLTNWSAATYCDFQRRCELDGINAIGLPRVLRQSSNANAPILDTTSNPVGSVAMSFDANPELSYVATGGAHIGRKIYLAPLEFSNTGLLFTPPSNAALFSDNFSTELPMVVLGGQNGWTDYSIGTGTKPTVNASAQLDMGTEATSAANLGVVIQTGAGSFSECIVKAVLNNASGNNGTAIVVGFTAMNAPFHFVYSAGGTTSLYYWSGSAATAISTLVATGGTAGTDYTLTVMVHDNTIFVYVAGYQVMQYTLRDRLTALVGYTGLMAYGGSTTDRLVKSFSVYAVPTPSTIYQSIPHGDFTAEFAVEIDALTDTGVLDFFYRLQSTSSLASGYRARIPLSGPPISPTIATIGALQTSDGRFVTGGASINGVKYTMNNQSMSPYLGLNNICVVPRFWHRLRVVVKGYRHQIFLDGEKQAEFVDQSYATGVAFALSAMNGACRVRLLSMRNGDGVTVTGLASGSVVTLRGPNGLPISSAVATKDAVTLPSPHFPQTSIDINGVDVNVPAGGLWGGDEYGYPVAAQQAPGFRPGFIT